MICEGDLNNFEKSTCELNFQTHNGLVSYGIVPYESNGDFVCLRVFTQTFCALGKKN